MLAPLGQMNPLLKTSSESPRTLTTSVPSSSNSSPHVASQSGQVAYLVTLSFAIARAIFADGMGISLTFAGGSRWSRSPRGP